MKAQESKYLEQLKLYLIDSYEEVENSREDDRVRLDDLLYTVGTAINSLDELLGEQNEK